MADREIAKFRSFIISFSYRRWGYRIVGFARAFRKSNPLGGKIYRGAPLFSGADPERRLLFVNPRYRLPTTRKEWYFHLRGSYVCDLGAATSLSTSASSRDDEDFAYNPGKGLRDK